MNLLSLPETLFQPLWLSGVFILSSNYLSHEGWNKVSGKLNRFSDFDNALTHHRDFVFGVLGVTEARSSYELLELILSKCDLSVIG